MRVNVRPHTRVAIRFFAVVASIVICLANCTTGSSFNSGTSANEVQPLLERANQSAELNADDYKIAPRDVLQVSVFQVADLNRTTQVDGNGFVSLPLLGTVKVAGKTLLQAQDEIAAKLGKTYIRSPQVSLSLVKSGQRVTINGAVKSPSVLTIDGKLTLNQAIAQAGGLSEIGNSERVHVARLEDGQVKDVIFSLEAIQSGKIPDPNLHAGDIIVVEDSTGRLVFKNLKDLLPFAVIGSLLSDIRVKHDVAPLVRLGNGLTLYKYRYLWSDTVYVGVIAQEVLQTDPDAIIRGDDGYLRVDYQRLGLELQTCAEWMAARTAFRRDVTCF